VSCRHAFWLIVRSAASGARPSSGGIALEAQLIGDRKAREVAV
jgi:hypothetical protein